MTRQASKGEFKSMLPELEEAVKLMDEKASRTEPSAGERARRNAKLTHAEEWYSELEVRNNHKQNASRAAKHSPRLSESDLQSPNEMKNMLKFLARKVLGLERILQGFDSDVTMAQTDIGNLHENLSKINKSADATENKIGKVRVSCLEQEKHMSKMMKVF